MPRAISTRAIRARRAGGREIEAALVGEAGRGHERHVGEARARADKEGLTCERPLHRGERRVAALEQLGVQLRLGPADIEALEAAQGAIGFVAVLLPEQPLPHPGPGKGSPGTRVEARARVPTMAFGSASGQPICL